MFENFLITPTFRSVSIEGWEREESNRKGVEFMAPRRGQREGPSQNPALFQAGVAQPLSLSLSAAGGEEFTYRRCCSPNLLWFLVADS